MPEHVPLWFALVYIGLLSLAGLAVVAYASLKWVGKMEFSVLAWTVAATLFLTVPFVSESALPKTWTLIPAGIGVIAGFWNWRIVRAAKNPAADAT